MDMYEKFKNVEAVLENFPKEVQANYYKNKENLKIEFVDDLSSIGAYYPDDNKIRLKGDFGIEHELFHMAFHDSKRYLSEIKPNVYLDNGVTYQEKNLIVFVVLD